MDNTYDKLTRFCLYRERCTYEVMHKMYALEVLPDDKEKFIQQLKEERYLDDERFIKAYIHTKIYIKKWGKNKIRAELSMKKLDKSLTKKILEEVDDELYIDNLHHLASRKWESLYKKEYRERQASLFRYLASKGYEPDLMMDWVKEHTKNKIFRDA